jgi:hypothetical protein
MNSADFIGKRGEATAFRALMETFSGPDPLFDPVPLGEKFATFDLFVRLRKVVDVYAFFFAQVKTTHRGVRPWSRTLPVVLPKEDVVLALRCRVPSYLLSVDDRTNSVYITAIDRRMSQGVSAVPTTHLLNADNARRLQDEVQSYWRGVRRPPGRSYFSL